MIGITKKLITCNFSKRTGKENKYIVIHYTTDRNGNALNSVNWFSNKAAEASAHYVVDADHIYQTVEDFNSAWHCGTKGVYKHPLCRNANSIGIEIASIHPNKTAKTIAAEDSGWSFDDKAVQNAIDLTVYLMKKYNIPIGNVIRHYDVTGKVCPAPFVNDNTKWTDFKNRVLAEYNRDDTQTPSAWAVEAWKKAIAKKITDGKDPHGACTREMVVVMLDRAGLLDN